MRVPPNQPTPLPPNQSTPPFSQHPSDGAYPRSQASQAQIISCVAQQSFSNSSSYNRASPSSPFSGSLPPLPHRPPPPLPHQPPPSVPNQLQLLSPPPPFFTSPEPFPNQLGLLSPPPSFSGSLPPLPHRPPPWLPNQSASNNSLDCVVNITADETTIDLSDADYNGVPSFVSSWMQYDMKEDEQDFLFAQIKKIIEAKSLDTLLLANSLIVRRDNMSGWEKGRILEEILATHPEKRKAVVAGALKLIGNNKMGGEDKILNVLRKIPSSELKDVIIQAYQSIQDNVDEEQKVDLLLETLGKIRQNASPVSSSSSSSRLSLPGNINDPLELVGNSTASAGEIAPPTVGFPPMDALESLKQSLIQEKMSKETKTRIENVLKKIEGPKKCQVQFIELANSLPVSNDNMYWYTKSRILEELQKIPPKKREQIVKKTLRLIDAGATGVDFILSALGKINSAETLEDVVVKTIKLIKPGMTGVDHILDALAEVSVPKKRTQLISRASPFIQDDMSGLEIYFILKSLQQIDEEIDVRMLEKTIKIAQDLILKGMSGRQKSDILDVARNIMVSKMSLNKETETPEQALKIIMDKVNYVFPDRQVADPNEYYYKVIDSYNSLTIGKINPVVPMLRS